MTKPRPLSFVAFAGASILSANSLAQPFHLTINNAASTFSGTAGATIPVSGNMIGNWNATTNPTGTRTVSSLFGTISPTRNDPINFTGSGTGSSAPNTRPTGSYSLYLDIPSGTVALYSLVGNMIGNSPPPVVNITASVTFPFGFRTVAPSYTYITGGVAIPLPVSPGQLTEFNVVQTASASGALVAGGPNQFTFALDVPVDTTTTVVVNGSPNTSTSPQILSVTGTVTVAGATATASLSFSNNSTQPIPPTPGTPTPVDLPSPSDLLNPPPAGTTPQPTAHVIVTANITGGSVTVNGSSALPGSGSSTSLADIVATGGVPGPDGFVTGDDFIAFINAFAAGDPLADIVSTGGNPPPDGFVTGDDYIAFINAFAAG